MELMVKEILRKYGYFRDIPKNTTKTALEQGKLFGYRWMN